MPKVIFPSNYAEAAPSAPRPAPLSWEAAARPKPIPGSAKRAATVTPENLAEQHPLKRLKRSASSDLSNATPRGPAATLPSGHAASRIKPEAEAVLLRTQHHERLRNLTVDDLQAAAQALRGKSRAGNNCVSLAIGILEFLQTGSIPEAASSRQNTHKDFSVEVMLGSQHHAIKQEPDADIDHNVDHEQSDEILTSTVMHHSDRLSAFIPADPVHSIVVGTNTIQMLDHVIYDVGQFNQPFMQFNDAPDVLRSLAQHCALANHGNGAPATYGLINIAPADANQCGHQLVYFARAKDVMFIDCQLIVGGKGVAVAPTLEALFAFGQNDLPAAFQSKIFVTPSYPFLAPELLRNQLNGRCSGQSSDLVDARTQPASTVTSPRERLPQQPAQNAALPNETPDVSVNTRHTPAAMLSNSEQLDKNSSISTVAGSHNGTEQRRIIPLNSNSEATNTAQIYGPALMALPPLGLGMTGEDIAKIAVRGGSEALEAVGKYGPALQALGVALEDIVEIAALSGGAKVLEAVGRHAPALQALGVALEDIVEIAANGDGSRTLDPFVAHALALRPLGMSIEDVVWIAANGDWSRTLEAFVKHALALRALGMAIKDIVKIAANGDGSKVLEAVGKHAPALQALGMSLEDIVRIAAKFGWLEETLEALGKHAPALRALGMAPGDIVKLADKGGTKALTAVRRHAPELVALGMASWDIVTIEANGGLEALEAVGKHAPALQALGMSNRDIVRIAVNTGGSKALEAVENHAYAPALMALPPLGLGMTGEDITKIAARGGSKALEAVGKHAPALQALGMSIKDIVTIAANTGGSKALEAVENHAPAFQTLGMSLEDIVRIAAKFVWSEILEHAPALRALGMAPGDIVKLADGGGTRALTAVRRHAPELLAQGMASWSIVTIEANGGLGALQTVAKHTPALRALGIALGDIVQIVVNRRSYVLAALVTHAPALRALGMPLADIVGIADNVGGSKALKALEVHAPALQLLGMGLVDLFKIAVSSGGSKTLKVIEENAPALRARGMTIEDIVELGARGGASGALVSLAEQSTS
jgi:DNA-directed RNA polymerase subunit H (RpoH/RPB5)